MGTIPCLEGFYIATADEGAELCKTGPFVARHSGQKIARHLAAEVCVAANWPDVAESAHALHASLSQLDAQAARMNKKGALLDELQLLKGAFLAAGDVKFEHKNLVRNGATMWQTTVSFPGLGRSDCYTGEATLKWKDAQQT